MDWCRLYGEMLDDPKVGTLDDAQFRTWVELLMVATKADAGGNTRLTPAESSINWALRRNATVTLQELLQRELVTLNENGEIVITEWDKRQKKSDSSAERVAKHRANQRLSTTNATVTLQERESNGLEKKREDKNREEDKSSSARATRLPEDWTPVQGDLEFCKVERPDLNPRAVAEQFRDYWVAQPGAKGRKTDWQATWRNWVRNQRASPRASPSAGRSWSEENANTIAALTGRNRSYESDDRTVDV